jgi:mono/diheme cytochrome c family protein
MGAAMSRRMRSLIAAGAAVAVMGAAAAASGQEGWTAPAAEKARKNPLPAGAKSVEQGKRVAVANCVTCHGADGKGNGAAAMALTPKPADWTSKKVQEETDCALYWKISSGRGAMPPWRHLPESDRWAVVHYLHSLKK